MRIRRAVQQLLFASLLIAGVGYYFALPDRLFVDPFATVLEDNEGQLLSASIAADGQWRFPEVDTVPEKFRRALIHFEDRRFYAHPGVDLLALGRAMRQNWRAGRIVSGGSTLTMQVIRLSRKDRPRTIWQKAVEIALATRLELRYSKEEILELYASHAPFGGNVVGLEAACWRYLGRSPSQISWAEAATLAVLPNNPSLIHPGRNQSTLLSKRNRLLNRLFTSGAIDSLTYSLALVEPIPEAPLALPRMAPHALDFVKKKGKEGERLATTINRELQETVNLRVRDHFNRLRANQIHNAAVLVVDVHSGNVLAYVGNTAAGADHNEAVDIVQAPRSTGSILKPVLYAAMLDEGKILPRSLQPDVPTLINGFAPENFSHQFDGAVPADQALIRSLNIPAVHQLRAYRYEKFHSLLTRLGLTTLTPEPDHYGLSLVLGGAEASLWEVTGLYASMARTLNYYFQSPGQLRYSPATYHSPTLVRTEVFDTLRLVDTSSPISAGALWQTFEVLKEVYRPGEESGWKYFHSSRTVAWKTGTSIGFRDGWAVGVTPEYVVGIWVGNADGEGRPGLTGTEAAAPILFDVFSTLPATTWFSKPLQELRPVRVCLQSGELAGEFCQSVKEEMVPVAGQASTKCRYHQRVFLTVDGRHRVHRGCYPDDALRVENWFILPPVQEYYFHRSHLSYRPLPPYLASCTEGTAASFDLEYPSLDTRIILPRELSGQRNPVVFRAVHSTPQSTLYWHLDDRFVGATQGTHHLPFYPSAGRHSITIVDESGQTLTRSFDVSATGS
ncbi:MAG: penicillin-binding protein 1C [Cyclobacteriaceae bacterium]|nr:penicillin-binding protein 1C [Cyclobacteriaceae bacterium]